ncbi:MAG: 2-hydroxyacid dehydrogenase [Labilithrix sp.]|nr:2-hydroxyacid dehydrogenase [Labilithrix sp.]
MRIAFFDVHGFEREHFERANRERGHELVYLEPRLTQATAALARGAPAVCCFVNDELTAATLAEIARGGTSLVALRSAGYNHVDVEAAEREGLTVARVPEYSPYAVAEHTVALVLALDRKIHRAHARVREGNFSLDGLVGFDLHGKTVGVVGTGKIGKVAATIFTGFGCRVLSHDVAPDDDFARARGVTYVSLPELYAESDVVTLHVPLTPATRHMIDDAAFARMKRGVMLVNTSRGALVDTRALIGALKRGHLGSAGLDVYEEEEGLFFHDLSDRVLQDDVLARLLTFPNVLVTAHQAFLTREALANIADVTLGNVTAFEQGRPLDGRVIVRPPRLDRAPAALAAGPDS